MLHIQTIRENSELIIQKLGKKGFDAREIIIQLLEKDESRRSIKQETEQYLAEANQIAKSIGQLFKEGKQQEAESLKSRTADLKNLIKQGEEHLSVLETEVFELQVQLPNIPSDMVPAGRTPEDNEIVGSFGVIPELDENALPHWELAKKYDLIDFELGVKITGAGFPVYKGKGARLQRALINFFLDQGLEAGYFEIMPPVVVNEASGFGTGQLPDKEGQMYFVGEDKLYLIPTAEVPITNIYRDVILKVDEMPIKNIAYTPCFRREAGSYGKDVRGLNRLHQFEKIEIVQITEPLNSYHTLEEMQLYVQGLLKKLGLPYRVLKLCGGDMSFASALTYDMEVFSAAQNRWLEVSSVSNFESFQSNRLKLRYKDASGNIQAAHTLNGSALALPRIVAALLENNQFEHGIRMPEVLHSYLGFENIT